MNNHDALPNPATSTRRDAIIDGIRRSGRSAVQAFGTATAPWRGLPEFLMIGAKRSGSTSLFRYLETHPNVAPLFPTARLPLMRENQKGVHYFDSNFHQSLNWYRGHFLTSRRRTRRNLIAGEASPYYLFHPLAAHRAATHVPNAKIIVMLRDPIERTFSHWSEQTRNGVETLSFREALASEADRLGAAADQLASGAIEYSFAHEQQSYATQSCYWESMQRWNGVFARSAVLVLRSEDFYAATQRTFDQVTDFLELDRWKLTSVAPWNAAPKLPIDADVHGALRDRFASDQVALARAFGIEWP